MFLEETKPPSSECEENEFRCDDGSCIDISRHCDRTRDCPDGSDEHECRKYRVVTFTLLAFFATFGTGRFLNGNTH